MRGFLYDLIFLRVMAPGLYLWGFLTPAMLVVVRDFLAALSPEDLVCLVLAMAKTQMILMLEVEINSEHFQRQGQLSSFCGQVEVIEAGWKTQRMPAWPPRWGIYY